MFRNIGNNVRTFVANKYMTTKNWNQKSDSILKSRDESVYEFQKKKKEEIIEKMNQLI